MKAPIFDSSWPQEVFALYEHDLQEIWDDGIAIHIWNQYQNQLSLYKSFACSDAGLDILDVGCAQATLALQLAEAGHRVSAVDLRQEFLDYAASRYEHGEIEFIQGNVLDLSLARNFDLVFANQIVEHLVYPMAMLGTLKKFLKPGGRLVVTTPNWHYLMSNLPSFTELGDPQAWESRQFSADGDGHFFAYQEVELRRIFCRAGLKDVATQFFESPWICGHMKLRYLHDKVSVGVLRKLDKLLLALPVFGKMFAHQLLVTGVRPQ
ncbi:MAG: methyltransferase domain-containing protein [Lysobacterales bacterium]|nr:MAG: methyltransferase domain-containing protein [Xanthomonadales bacterium]